MVKMMKVRPSSLLEITEPLAAFNFDRAVWMFGSALEQELSEVDGRTKHAREAKTQSIIDSWLPDQPKVKRFADPAARVKKGS